MLAFGSYVPAASVIHQMNAQVKVILACAFSICAVAAGSWLALGVLWAAVIAGFAAARLDVRCMAAGVAPIAVLLLFTVAAHTFSFGQAPAGAGSWDSGAASLGFTQTLQLCFGWQASLGGFVTGCFFALRIALVLVACALLTATTSQTQVVQALQGFLSPLRRVRVPVDDICTVISMALRFVPTVASELAAIKRARMARGALFEGAGAAAAVKAWAATITPLFVALFRHADMLARAMDARCYGACARTSSSAAKMRAADIAIAVAGVALMVAIVALL